jgi:hypothetical protein
MKNIFRLILLAALVALGFWLWIIFFPSPEKAIRMQLTKLARDISFSKDEGSLARITDAESLSGFFSTNVEVTVNIPGYEQHTLVGRAEITQVALASRSRASELSVQFPDVTVTVAPDKQSAAADVTAEMNVDGEKDAIVQEMKFTFEKTAEGWLIKRVETIRLLS